MRAIIYDEFGGPQVLRLAEMPAPEPNAHQLLVRVKACALNRADLLQRKGKYPPPAGESDILGLEIAGEVVSVPDGNTHFKPGDHVFGLVGSGAYAEYCLLDQGMAMLMPPGCSFAQAAAIPEAFLTAQEALFTLGQLATNDSILIHAGASGVGTAAIQLAALKTTAIFTTVSTDEKMEKIKSLGCQHIINYKTDDLFFELQKLTENKGFNVIIDFVGAKYLDNHLQLLQPDGRLVIVGLMGGTNAEINLSLIQKNRLQLKGLAMRTKTLAEKRALTARFKQDYLPLFATGKLKPIIDSTFSFQDVQLAHQHMENNANVGKIVLEWD
jgi:putative PIG3 family NAD(P)H quinone oxidoreductase